MKKLNFVKLGVFLILVSIAFIADRSQRSVIKDQDLIVAQLRLLHEEYRSSFSKTDRDRIARRAIDLIEGNAEVHLPSDLTSFVVVTMTTPTE